MLIHKAIQFATLAHKNQLRKSTSVPYIAHLFEVALILTKAGASDELVCGGILHDTLEDTPTTKEDLLTHFGERVTNLVLANSENKSLTWEERKEETIHYIKNKATEEELMLICADKLSNARSSLYDKRLHGNAIWDRFNRGYDKQKWYYTNLVIALEKLNHLEMYQEFANIVKELFTE